MNPLEEPDEFPRDGGDLAELSAVFSKRIRKREREIKEQPDSALAFAAEIEKRALEQAHEHVFAGKEAMEQDHIDDPEWTFNNE